MTKKRFKFSLAALGLMMAFLLALMALLLAPSLASADKNSGNPHNNNHHDTGSAHGGGVNPIYFQTGNGSDGGHDAAPGGSADYCAFANHVCTDGDGKPGTQTFGGDAYTGSGAGSDGEFGNPSNGSGGAGGQGNGFYPGFFGGGNGGGNGGSNGGSTGEPGHDGTGPGGDGPGDSGHGPHIPELKIDPPGDDTPLLPDFDTPFITDFSPPGDGPQTFSSVDPEQVPEPLTLSLFAAGLAGTAALRRRRKGQ